MRSSSGAARRPSPALIVVVLALLLSLQPVTTDLYLPALPSLTAELAAPISAAQMTLSGLLLAFGIGQLLVGPASDRFGRRPVLLAGLALYLVASIAAAWSAHVLALVGWRTLQGFALAAAVVCARAMVRDLYEPHDGAQVMSAAMSGLGIVALAAPLVGGALAAAFGWRAALLALSVYSASALALVALRMPETLRAPRPDALHWRTMAGTWSRIGRHPAFVAWAMLAACTYGGLITFLAGSSFIFIDVLGRSRPEFGAWLAACSASYLAGTLACRRWVRLHGLAGAVSRGALCTLAGGLSMAIAAWSGLAHPLALALPQALYAFGHGVHQPCSQVAVTGPFPRHAGAASALAGFVLALCAVGASAWLGVALDGSVQPFATTICVFALATAALAWTLVQRHGAPAAAAEPA